MTGRRWFWCGAAVTLVTLVGLARYFAAVGLDKADKLASVIGAFLAVAGLAVSVYGLLLARAEGRGGGTGGEGSTTPRRRLRMKSKGTQEAKITQVSGNFNAPGAPRARSTRPADEAEMKALGSGSAQIVQVDGDYHSSPGAS